MLAEILSKRNDICDFAMIESALVMPMRITEYFIAPSLSLCYPLIKKRWFAKLQFQSLHIHASLFENYFNDSSLIKKEDMISFLRANSGYQLKDTITGCQAKTLILVGGKERRIMKMSAELLSEKLHFYDGRDLQILCAHCRGIWFLRKKIRGTSRYSLDC